MAYGDGSSVEVAFPDDSDEGLDRGNVRLNLLHGAYRAGTVDVWEVSDAFAAAPGHRF